MNYELCSGDVPIATLQKPYSGDVPIATLRKPYSGDVPIATLQKPYSGDVPITKKPQRTCVICRRKRNKDELYRFVVLAAQTPNPEHQTPNTYFDSIVLDLKHRIQCFGYYLCKEHTDYEAALRKWLKKKNIKKLTTTI